MFTTYWSLIYLGLGLILLELIVGVQTGFDLVLVGLALILGGLCGWVTGSMQVAFSVAAILSFAYIVFGRKIVKAKIGSGSSHKINTDALVGQKATVFKEIKPQFPGQVKIKGEVWRAESETECAVGNMVEVVGFEGVTLKVKKLIS